ncbi:hypothetical protein TU78_12725 [Pseudomonas taetrolens]|uniref:Uncharacterized protein n=1 Tax=Pseudomonas taetrolens TaxID=47884 RepID=A0A0J6GPT3_PSETA|nr:hypothetical protein TU78_12725 [Pseudomonas taetrolens]
MEQSVQNQQKVERDQSRNDKKCIQQLERELLCSALSVIERQAIVTLCNSPAYAHLHRRYLQPQGRGLGGLRRPSALS